MKVFIYILASMVFLTACYKDSELEETVIEIPEPIEFVDGNVAGIVQTEDLEVASGVNLVMNGSSFKTGSQGFFFFEGSKIRKDGEIIYVLGEKGERFAHLIRPEWNDVQYTRITYKENLNEAQFAVSQDFELSFDQGGNISGNDVSFSDFDGNPHQGEVLARGYTSVQSDIGQVLDLPQVHGIDQLGRKVHLTMHSGMYLNFTSLTFENLDPTHQFSAVFPKPSTTSETWASATLWYFDTAQSAWIEQGIIGDDAGGFSAILDNDGYWCVASKTESVGLTGVLSYGDVPIANATIAIEDEQGNWIAQSQTSNKGNWHVSIPKNEVMKLNLRAPFCDDVIYTEFLGPQTENTDILVLNLEGKAVEVQSYEGYVRDCEGALRDGFVKLETSNGSIFFASDEGKFHSGIAICNPGSIDIVPVDINDNTYGPVLSWTGKTENTIGSIYLCPDALDEYMMVEVDGGVQIYWQAESVFTGNNRTVLSAESDTDPDVVLDLIFDGQSIGPIQDMELNIVLHDAALGSDGYTLYCPTSQAGCGFDTFAIWHYDDTGDWICGTFSGEFWVSSVTLDPNLAYYKKINGEFRVKRDF